MIRVSPEMDAEKIKSLCERCGIKAEENALCYFIYVDERLCGICLFKLIKGGGRIIALRNIERDKDRDALIIAGRTCLEFTERTAGTDAYFEEDDADTAKELGFNERDGRLYLDMHGYFGTCAGCAGKK